MPTTRASARDVHDIGHDILDPGRMPVDSFVVIETEGVPMGWMRHIALGAALAAALAAAVPTGLRADDLPSRTQRVEGAGASTLERVREAGVLRCGVSTSGIGLAVVDRDGRWEGFFPDFCRAVAAAALRDPNAVEFIEIGAASRFSATRDGTVDVTMQGNTWTMHRDMSLGVDVPAVYLYDGQGFMAHRSRGWATLAEVDRGTVCVLEGTTTIENLAEWIRRSRPAMEIRRFRTTEGALAAFFNHHCDLMTNDRIGLYAQRLLNAPAPDDYVVMPEVISKEPLGPLVAENDPVWRDVVRWTVLATVLAEELGITAETARAASPDVKDPEARRLLGLDPGIGNGLGLDDGWARRVVAAIGNYGELFDRRLGRGSPLRAERGVNAQWSEGGLMYAPPLGR